MPISCFSVVVTDEEQQRMGVALFPRNADEQNYKNQRCVLGPAAIVMLPTPGSPL